MFRYARTNSYAVNANHCASETISRTSLSTSSCGSPTTSQTFTPIGEDARPNLEPSENWRTKLRLMKNYTEVLCSILVATICTVRFAADKLNCKKAAKTIR